LKHASAGVIAGAAGLGAATYFLGEKTRASQTATAISTSTSGSTAPYYPPTVVGPTYTPTRIVKDKIYDIRLNFNVDNPSKSLTDLEVQLIPVEYPHLRKEAFPEEESRTVHPSFQNLQRESVVVDFGNLKGGREYQINVLARDDTGIPDQKTLLTAYVRQFENAGKTDGILVGAFYYEWYDPDDPWFTRWGWYSPDTWKSFGYNASPLLGQYSSNDPMVVNKHIDWATGHGVDYFLVHWGSGPGKFDDTVFKSRILTNPLIAQMKFCILYESASRLLRASDGTIPVSDAQKRSQLLADFDYLADTYFGHPSYLEIQGKKVVFFDASRSFVGDVEGALMDLRSNLTRKGYDLYLMCDALGNYLPPIDSKMLALLRSFDAVTADDMWANNYGDPNAQHDFVAYTDQALRLWGAYVDKQGKTLIPSINPGWEPYAYYKMQKDFNAPFLKRDPERYGKLLSIGLEHSINHIIVGHWNEFFTHSHIEPDTKDGFQYVQVLREALISKE